VGRKAPGSRWILQINVFTGGREHLQRYSVRLVRRAAQRQSGDSWPSEQPVSAKNNNNRPVPKVKAGGDDAVSIAQKCRRPLRLSLHAELHRERHSKPAPLAAHRKPSVGLALLMPSSSVERSNAWPHVKKTMAGTEEEGALGIVAAARKVIF
jgi:hypothetical protein